MSHFGSWEDYQIFARSVRTRRRYIRTVEEESFLEAVRSTVKDRIVPLPAGWEFWRAQRGYCEGIIEQWCDEAPIPIPAARPYPPERMKPRPNQASEGRVNPKGIPCLYGARSPDTAVAEVRPWKGELVSIGKFSLCRSVQIIECLKYHDEDKHHVLMNTPFYAVRSETGEIVEYRQDKPSNEDVTTNVWTHIDQAFSEPITHSDDHADYSPTQILAEVFRAEGYDGICYPSKLSDQGVNVALFDLEVATITSRHLIEVIDVKIVSQRHESRGIDFYSGKPITK
jgi:RES domain-containing protein